MTEKGSRKKKYQKIFLSFSRPRKLKIIGLFVLLAKKMEIGGSSFFEGRSSPLSPTFLAPIFDTLLRGSRSKMEGSTVFGPENSRICLARKGFTETKMRRSNGQQPERKSTSRPGDKPRINRGSTADFVPAFGLHRMSVVRASGEAFRRRVFDALEGTKDSCLPGDQFCWHPVLPDPAPPSAGRPDPTRPWYVPVLGSTGRRL